jgi:tRNA U34 5-methylaminomethyl-2-thiouridine-forming methyltransferase MnmC
MTNKVNIAELENKISKMKKEGKYTASFLFIFSSTKNLELKSENLLILMQNYLTKKGY